MKKIKGKKTKKLNEAVSQDLLEQFALSLVCRVTYLGGISAANLDKKPRSYIGVK